MSLIGAIGPDGRTYNLKAGINGQLATQDGGTLKSYSSSVLDSAGGTINQTTTISSDFAGRNFRLVKFGFTAGAAPTTSESVTVTLAPGTADGNRPATTEFSANPSLSSATSLVQIWEDRPQYFAGDEFTIAFANTEDKTIKVELIVEIL
jgi:hypothetical protein|tara:strand:+ start:418 stop:867 length:450 start_codon:yes stop_codon:yes gene_type:complete